MYLCSVVSSVIALNFYLVLGFTELTEHVGPELSPNCTEVREAFANASSAFIKCSIEFSRPITFCENCVTQYIHVLNRYRNISQVSNNGTSCINSFINLDRLNIVQTLFENSVNLWNQAKCYECFVIENGTQTNKSSPESELFGTYYTEFNKCLNETQNEEICAFCMDKYTVLQDYFLSISNENEKIGVCMDIVDLMNTTWTYWGDKCCKFRRHNEYTFIISSLVVILATILFYTVAQVYAKKKSPTIVEQTRFLNTLDT